MDKKFLKLKIKQIIKEAMKESFNMNYLLKLPSFEEKIKYCQNMLGDAIGQGSSRLVFQIDDSKVLKLAINEFGQSQNKVESNNNAVNRYPNILPHTYYQSPDMSVIISEFVLEAKMEDFEKCLGVSFWTFSKFLWRCQYMINGENKRRMCSEEEFNELLNSNSWFKEFYKFMTEMKPSPLDIDSRENLGMTLRNNKPTIVVLDSGLNQEVFDKFFK